MTTVITMTIARMFAGTWAWAHKLGLADNKIVIKAPLIIPADKL